MTLRHIENLVDQQNKIKGTVYEAVKAYFSVGVPVEWMLGRHVQHGTAIDASRDCIKVRNDSTGKVFWVNLYRILEVRHKRRSP